ncbi:uncharacterized protein BDZ99DRAFT_462021 [Mytilinidion resinicola]|uniref:F-box domain-containing protein n=1 Tax=Mytilinidion resinicola TaxID=574789 RepID=A0A6A6YRY2_9PEZI|nr:uncharacterized protein BDZ99DRAFT_462021 [Mytilinidion resinicola]KAF2810667.1 hypothetical protein BDZ99DRAFT_462021 [Mytilinidion resinicola]
MAHLAQGKLNGHLTSLPEELILKILAYIFESSDESWDPITSQPDFPSLLLTSKQLSRLTDTFRYRHIKLLPHSLTSLKESVVFLRDSALAASVRSVDIVHEERNSTQEKSLLSLVKLSLSSKDQKLVKSAVEDIGMLRVLSAHAWVTAILFRLPRLTALRLPPSTMETGLLTTYPPFKAFQEHPNRLPRLRKLSLATDRGVSSESLISILQATSLRTLEIEGWKLDNLELSELSSPIEHLILLPHWHNHLLPYVAEQKNIITSFKALRSITIKIRSFPGKYFIDFLLHYLQAQKHSLEHFHLSGSSPNETIDHEVTLVNFHEFSKLRTIVTPTVLIFRHIGGSDPPSLAKSLPRSLECLTINGYEPVPARIIELASGDFPNMKSVTVRDRGNFPDDVYEAFRVANIEFTDRGMLEGHLTAAWGALS